MTRRITLKDILVPGAQVSTGKVDVDADPELRRLFDETQARQEEAAKLLEWTQDDYDAMHNVVTI